MIVAPVYDTAGALFIVRGEVKMSDIPADKYNNSDRLGTTEYINDETAKAQERLEEHIILSAAISASYDRIYDIDLNANSVCTISLVNGYITKKVHNFTYESMMKFITEVFIHPDDSEKFEKRTSIDYIRNNLGGERSSIYLEARIKYYKEEKFYAHKNKIKDYYWESFTYKWVHGMEGSRVMLFLDDIDERKISEIERQKSIIDAYNMTKAANSAKSDFLSKMSHDIRTPMNGIIGMAAIAKSRIDDKERVSECLEKIELSAQNLLSLINEILDMSKIESGKITLNDEEVNLSRLIESIETMVRPQAEVKHQMFTVRRNNIIHEDIMGDGLRLRQVFLNILSNSVKYTQEGGCIEIEINERPSKIKEIANFEFIFRDNGMGMSEEYQKIMFEPFSRADCAGVGKIQGTGLGMTIVKQIVNMMNGEINVKSKLNEGTEFMVDLYFKLPDKDYEEHKKSDGGHGNERSMESVIRETDLSGYRVLLVEDNEIGMDIAAEVISYTNAEIDKAENGRIAFEKVKDNPPGYYDIALMDVQMPEMNGYEATRAIRELDRADTKTLPIIACTANAFSDDINDAIQAGMNAHIAKPINFEELMRVMKKWLN